MSDRTSSVSSVWAGRGGRQQEALEVGCHHRHRPTEHSIHTAGVLTPPGCSQKCDGRKHCVHSRKACLSRVCLPESGFLSPICSQVIWTGAAHVYLRGAFMTHVHTSYGDTCCPWFRLRAGTEVCQGCAEHPRCRLGRRVLEETWAQGQSEESQRRKTIRLLPVLWKQVRSDTQFKGSVNIAHSKCSV